MVHIKWQENWRNSKALARIGKAKMFFIVFHYFFPNFSLSIFFFSYGNRSNSDSEDDIEPDTVDQEYPSLDSVPSDNSLTGATTFSPRNSEPPSLTESMQLMDEILSDKTMDRIERIDKLEAILSAATLLPSDPVRVFKFPSPFKEDESNLNCAI